MLLSKALTGFLIVSVVCENVLMCMVMNFLRARPTSDSPCVPHSRVWHTEKIKIIVTANTSKAFTPKTVLTILHSFTHLTSEQSHEETFFFYLHFTNEETEAKKV